MVVDQNSFIPERPFFANKKFTFAKLSRTPCLSFTGPMLANNTSYEDSFTTCQITPENHGSLLGSLLNMQLASRNPFSGQIFFLQSLLAHPLQHALWLSPALSHNFRGTFAKIPIHRPRPSAGGALKEWFTYVIVCIYFCANPTLMVPARECTRHHVNTPPTQWHDVAWSNMCMWRK